MVEKLATPRPPSEFQRIARAMTAVAGAGVAVKLLATFKEFVVAGVYGRTDAMDAFLAACLIPNLIINLLAESMNQALIPTLVRVRLREGQERAQALLANSMLRLSLLLLAAIAGMALLARFLFPLIASNFPPQKLSFSIHLFYALLPIVLATGLATTCSSVLNTVHRYTVPTLSAALIPLVTMAFAVFFHAQFGIWALIYGTVIGAVAQTVLTASMLRGTGYFFALRWDKSTEASKEVARQYGPLLLSALISSGGSLTDQAMAAMLPAGSISALAYAVRFISAVSMIFSSSVATTLTPHFSDQVARRDWNACRRTMHQWTRIMAAISIPIALALIVGAPALIRLTLQHGVFGPRDTAAVAPVLAMYAIQIPFVIVSRVHYRFILAMRRTEIIFYCGIITLILDIILNIVLMRWMGLPGIALATSLWTVATLIFLRFWAHRLLREASSGKTVSGEDALPYASDATENL